VVTGVILYLRGKDKLTSQGVASRESIKNVTFGGHIGYSSRNSAGLYIHASLAANYCNVPGVLFAMEVYFRSKKSTHYS
jgi:hypothetical protein